MIAVRGEGSEPKVEFTSSVLEFGPILPHSFGDEKEVTVQNPSSFPVEIYSLEFDKQYLEEEKVTGSKLPLQYIHSLKDFSPLSKDFNNVPNLDFIG